MSVDYCKVLEPPEASKLKCSNKITFNFIQAKAQESKTSHTSKLNEVTKIYMEGSGPLALEEPLTLHTVFKNAIEKGPKHSAMKYKFSHTEKFKSISFGDYYRLSCFVAKSFIQLGLEMRHSVCISGFNSPPWMISYMGCIFAGGVASGSYTTNQSEIVLYILNNCLCQFAVVENPELVCRYLEVAPSIPSLKGIIQFQGEIDPELKAKSSVPLYDWEEFVMIGIKVSDEDLLERLQSNLPNECCSLVYTSGTTGDPKGVMMSHDNLIWTVQLCKHYLKVREMEEHFISYLPLSHVAAQICDIILPLFCIGTVWFAQPDALEGTLGKTLKEVRPTIFVGVPRVYEKISETMKEIGLTMSPLKQKISAWAKKVGLARNLAIMNKEPLTSKFAYIFAKWIIFNKVRANLGFGRCKHIFSAAAPISMEIVLYFASLDLIVCEIYGMSETCGPHTIDNLFEEYKFGSVGKGFPEVQTKFYTTNDSKAEGEVCMKGRNIFMGYVGLPEKTKETFDDEEWLHSGDIGQIDQDGYVKITGRNKELIITASGENIAPVPIEEKIKECLPFISNALLIGDKEKFLAVLFTIKSEMNTETQYPTDEMTEAARRWCKGINYKVTHVSQMINDRNPKVISAIDKVIKNVNHNSMSSMARINKWVFLPCDFSIGGGELGPTMKVKRAVVCQMYANIINEIYER